MATGAKQPDLSIPLNRDKKGGVTVSRLHFKTVDKLFIDSLRQSVGAYMYIARYFMWWPVTGNESCTALTTVLVPSVTYFYITGTMFELHLWVRSIFLYITYYITAYLPTFLLDMLLYHWLSFMGTYLSEKFATLILVLGLHLYSIVLPQFVRVLSVYHSYVPFYMPLLTI